jgi:cell division protein FtsB
MRKYRPLQETSRPLVKRVAGRLAFFSVMFYLGFHAFSGERGLFALYSETRRLEELKTELVEVKAQREALAHKVKLLSSNSLDLDMLDEQARFILGKVGRNEIVYFLNDNNHSTAQK